MSVFSGIHAHSPKPVGSGMHALHIPSGAPFPTRSSSSSRVLPQDTARSRRSSAVRRKSYTQQQEGSPSDVPAGPPFHSPTHTPTATSHSLHTKRIKLCTTSQELAAVLEEHGAHLNYINVAAALVQLAHLPPGPQPPPPGSSSETDAQAWDAYASYEALLQQLLQLVASQASGLGARQVANSMWAAARLGSRSPDGFHPLCGALISLLLPQSQVMLPWSNAQELSCSLWAIAVSGISPPDEWLEAFLLAFETALPDLVREPRHVSTVMWGLGRMGVAPDCTWLAALEVRVQQLLPAFSPRDIAQLLAGYANLGFGAESGAMSQDTMRAAQQQLLRGLQAGMGVGEETEQLRSGGTLGASSPSAPVSTPSSNKPGTSSHSSFSKRERLAQLRQRQQQRQQQAQQEAAAYQERGALQVSLQQQQQARRAAWQGQLEGQRHHQHSHTAHRAGEAAGPDVRSHQDTSQGEQTHGTQSPQLEADFASTAPLEAWAEHAVSADSAPAGAGGELPAAGSSSLAHSGSGAISSEDGAHALSTCLWALAVMGWVPPLAWMEETFALVLDHLAVFNPHSLSMVMWAAVALGQRVPVRLVHAMYGATTPSLHAYPPRSVACLVWAVSVADGAHRSSSASVLSRPMQPPQPWAEALLSSVATNLPLYCGHSLSLVLVSLARLGITPDRSWAAHAVTHLTGPLAPHLGPQALVNSMWALAKMGFTLNEQGVLALMTLLRERLPVFLPPSSPSSAQPPLHPLHTTPIPASAAHCPPQASHPSGPSAAQTAAASARQPTRSLSLNAQELSNLLYALARFGHAPGPDMQHDLLAACSQYMHTRSYSQPPPTHHSSSTGTVSLGTSSASGAATAALSRPFNAQELSNVLWSLSQLGVQPSDAWLGDFWMAVLHQIRAFNAKDLSQVVYALAKLGRQPPSASISHVQSSPMGSHGRPSMRGPEPPAAHEPHMQAQSPPNAAMPPAQHASLSPLHVDSSSTPSPSSVPAWARALLQEAAATFSRCGGQDLANLGWGLAQLGVVPGPQWCAQFASALQSRAEVFSGSHLAVCLWSLGRMNFRPPPQSLLPLEGALYRRMPHLSARELAACVWAFSAMAYMPDVEWLEAFAQRCMAVASSFTQQEWSVVVCSLAHIVGSRAELGVYLEDLVIMPQLEARIPAFGPAGLAMLAYACGQLGGKAGRIMGRLLAAATPQLHACSGPELSALITSCARLGQAPGKIFMQAWMAEVAGRLQAQAPPQHTAAAAAAEAARRRSTAVEGHSGAGTKGFGRPSPAQQHSGTSRGIPAFPQGGGPGVSDGGVLQPGLPTQTSSTPSARDSSQPEPPPPEPTAGRADDDLTSAPQAQQQEALPLQQEQPLPGSVLSCFAWALARLQLRPKQSWCTLFQGALLGQLSSLTAQELVMVTWALCQWGMQVDVDLYKGIVERARVHRVQYSVAERRTLKATLLELRELCYV